MVSPQYKEHLFKNKRFSMKSRTNVQNLNKDGEDVYSHNSPSHDDARYTAGSPSISTRIALRGSLVFHTLPSGLCERYSPDSSPFICYTLSDQGSAWCDCHELLTTGHSGKCTMLLYDSLHTSSGATRNSVGSSSFFANRTKGRIVEHCQ